MRGWRLNKSRNVRGKSFNQNLKERRSRILKGGKRVTTTAENIFLKPKREPKEVSFHGSKPKGNSINSYLFRKKMKEKKYRSRGH